MNEHWNTTEREFDRLLLDATNVRERKRIIAGRDAMKVMATAVDGGPEDLAVWMEATMKALIAAAIMGGLGLEELQVEFGKLFVGAAQLARANGLAR